MTEPVKLSEIKFSDLMPKLNPDAVAALRDSMLAMGAAAAQYEQALKKTAPGIMANIANALPNAAPLIVRTGPLADAPKTRVTQHS